MQIPTSVSNGELHFFVGPHDATFMKEVIFRLAMYFALVFYRL